MSVLYRAQGLWLMIEFKRINLVLKWASSFVGFILANVWSQLNLPVLDPKMTATVDQYSVGEHTGEDQGANLECRWTRSRAHLLGRTALIAPVWISRVGRRIELLHAVIPQNSHHLKPILNRIERYLRSPCSGCTSWRHHATPHASATRWLTISENTGCCSRELILRNIPVRS